MVSEELRSVTTPTRSRMMTNAANERKEATYKMSSEGSETEVIKGGFDKIWFCGREICVRMGGESRGASAGGGRWRLREGCEEDEEARGSVEED